MTDSIDSKRTLILDHETRLANLIANDMIQRPELSLWMILIPVVFVYYFYGLNRYRKGRQEFVKHFIFSRRLILDQAIETVETGRKPDFEALILEEKVPEGAVDSYRSWAKVLCESYVDLLESQGNSYEELVRARFSDKGSYLLIQNRITTAEKQFYRSLRQQMDSSVADAADVIKKMEKSLEHLRRQEAVYIYA